MEALFPLTTFELEHPDFNSLDMQSELERYFARQKAISACLSGHEHPDVVLDLLESHSIDPVAYVDETEQAIDFIIDHQILIED
jgi:hypothetical protein